MPQNHRLAKFDHFMIMINLTISENTANSNLKTKTKKIIENLIAKVDL